MLVQVIDELDPLVVLFPRDRHVVDHRQMLHIFAQPDASGMRPHRQAELGCHQLHRQHLVQPAQAATVDLHEVDGPVGDELLEQNPVLAHLARRHLDRGNGLADLAMAEHVVGAGRFLDEQWPREGEGANPFDGLIDLPDLVGVDHDVRGLAQFLAGDRQAPDVVVEAAPHLELGVGEACSPRLAAKPAELVVGIAEPAGRRGIAGIALVLQCFDPFDLARFGPAQDIQRFLPAQHVGHVAEIDQLQDVFRRHFPDQQPDRFARFLRQKIPHGIDHRAGGEVDCALVRADPAQLAITGDMAPEPPHVLAYPVEVEPDHQVPHGLDRGDADLVAAPDGKGQAVALMRAVGFQYHIGGRIVRVGVHRVRTIERVRRREPQVVRGKTGDLRHWLATTFCRCEPSPSMPSSTTSPGFR